MFLAEVDSMPEIEEKFDLYNKEKSPAIIMIDYEGSEEDKEKLEVFSSSDFNIKYYLLDFIKNSHLIESEPGIFKKRMLESAKKNGLTINLSFSVKNKKFSCLIYKDHFLERLSSKVNNKRVFPYFLEKNFALLKIYVERLVTNVEAGSIKDYFLKIIDLYNRKYSPEEIRLPYYDSTDTVFVPWKVQYIIDSNRVIFENFEKDEYQDLIDSILETYRTFALDQILYNVLWREVRIFYGVINES